MPLIESRINDHATLVIDSEAVGGIDKGTLSVHSHPDKIAASAIHAIRTLAEELGTSMIVDTKNAPVAMEIQFAVRIDSGAVVQIGRTPEAGQFRVTLKWDA